MACACKNKTTPSVKQVVKKNVTTKKAPLAKRTILKRTINGRHPLK